MGFSFRAPPSVMTQPHVKKAFRWMAVIAVMYGVSTAWKLPLPSFIFPSQLFSHRAAQLDSAPATLVGAYGRMMQPQCVVKAFLKDVVFGGMAGDQICCVNFSQYYVETERTTNWRYCAVLSSRKAAKNSTVARSASFGPNGQYYFEFKDNWRFWNICDPEIGKIVKENSVKFVSFGPKGAVIAVLKSGAYYFRSLARTFSVCSLRF
eukprot:Skav212896  [mRNA]  locus=scaffold374:52937:53677:+ [translate_table: standard]